MDTVEFPTYFQSTCLFSMLMAEQSKNDMHFWKNTVMLAAEPKLVWKQITNASSLLDLFETSPDANIGDRSYEAVNHTIYNILDG